MAAWVKNVWIWTSHLYNKKRKTFVSKQICQNKSVSYGILIVLNNKSSSQENVYASSHVHRERNWRPNATKSKNKLYQFFEAGGHGGALVLFWDELINRTAERAVKDKLHNVVMHVKAWTASGTLVLVLCISFLHVTGKLKSSLQH